MAAKDGLEFAYKYPFSDEAKVVIKELDLRSIAPSHLQLGKERLEKALQEENLEYTKTSYVIPEFVISYVYARMLLSAMKNSTFIQRYSTAESKRAGAALEMDSDANLLRLAKELELEIMHVGDDYEVAFETYLQNIPNDESFRLANQRLNKGYVLLDRHRMIRVIEIAAKSSIEKGLPIKYETLPKAVVECARGVKRPIIKAAAIIGAGENISWIDKLLSTPIADCRHRTVNLILAPYLVNIKGMAPEKATEVISNYITLCKTVNPDTNVTDRYIKYQCEYAKSKGIRPMSLKRARTELGGIDFVAMFGEDAEEKIVERG